MKKQIIKWSAPVFACLGQLFIIFQNPLAFIFWTIGEGIMLWSALKRKDTSEVVFLVIYVVTNIIALINWILS